MRFVFVILLSCCLTATAQFGKALAAESNGVWTPLMPVGVIRSNENVWVTFTNTVGGLVWDTNNVLAVTNFGFNFYTNWSSTSTSNTPVPLASVSLVRETTNQVLLVLSGVPPNTASNLLTYAAWDSGLSGYLSGTNQLRGNLRNRDSMVGYSSSSNLWDWCVHFITTNVNSTTLVQP